ncbi:MULTISPECIES: SRPBCC family protein [Streptomyces]|uniref:Polyketide cyclase n=1 Tax=Streptomyces atratus TaxID=1893 RepID=A0A2Z5J9E8_STRAR|nr:MULTISPECIES: SRPBCC family protein [Streptomyces]AXE76884.1 polyketide cyclase [Streptomyces atratus]MEE1810696.1 SRPBCC family protein [Streptomyces sp. BE133]WPW27773.1 SRPBCC family protein [Streptomyces atratus]GGT21784.1 polyketide cyclase [Streptomyces atratus]
MDWSHYRFVSIWDLPGKPDAVYEILGRADDYPRWWPQIREVTSVDGATGTTRIRSFLPYDLVMTVRERRRDPRARVLEATLSGDLDGWARWTVTAHGAGSRATYEQEVEVHRRLMRILAVPGRAVFRANHALMMRAGRRGLTARLEGV